MPPGTPTPSTDLPPRLTPSHTSLQPRDGGSAGGSWVPGTLSLSGQLFVFSGAIKVPGTATASRVPNADFTIKVGCEGLCALY